MRFRIVLILVCFLFTSCAVYDKQEKDGVNQSLVLTSTSSEDVLADSAAETTGPIQITKPVSYVNPDGAILKDRFITPDGFSRIEGEDDSFAEYLQNLPLKPDGSKVMYFDGREKSRNVYMAVVDYTLGNRDLQQCADAVMRLRAEYLYFIGRQDEISFNFVSGFTANFSKWADGYGVSVNGNDVSWTENNRNDGSYDSFQRYLDIVYSYSSTLSLEKELISKDIGEISIGDVFIIGGSPGHCVIVVDMAANKNTGEKVFMIAQSYMPAQDIQILKSNVEGSPWYSDKIDAELITPEWTFSKSQLKTWQ